MQIDHLMWACSDLAMGIDEIALLTGVTPVFSGCHTGLGTRNALLSLSDDCYLEIIAPDPDQTLEDNFGSRLQALKSTGLLAFALTSGDLRNLRQRLMVANFKLSNVRKTEREASPGEVLVWALLFVAGIEGAPFYIDWLNCVHPSQTSPLGCSLVQLEFSVPNLASYQPLFGDPHDPKLMARQGKAISLSAKIKSPKGVVELSSVRESVALF